MADKIQIRRDVASNWASINPTLSAGEFGLDLTNNILKIGDGVTAWTSLDSIALFGDLSTVATTGSYNDLVDVPANFTTPVATNTTLGGVIIPDGGNLTVDSGGNLTTTGLLTESTANSTFIPFPDYTGTSLSSFTFLGSGSLALTSNTTNSEAIGYNSFSGYQFGGITKSSSDTFQFIGVTDLIAGTVTPTLYRGNSTSGTSGIVAIDGDTQLLNSQKTNSSSLLSYGYANSTFAKITSTLNSSTANSVYSFTDNSISGLPYSALTLNNNGPSSTNSVRNDWMSNSGRFGNIQWILHPDTGLYNWVWGGVSMNSNTTSPSRATIDFGINYSLNFGAGNAYGRGIQVTPYDVVLTETYFSGPALPTKEWSNNSFLTRSYADTRYLQGTGVSNTFTTADGKAVTVVNGIITNIL